MPFAQYYFKHSTTCTWSGSSGSDYLFYLLTDLLHFLHENPICMASHKPFLYRRRPLQQNGDMKERETEYETTCMQAAFSTRTNLVSPLPALPLPPSQTLPINAIREASCVYFRPPSPTHVLPIAEFEQFSATSAKVEDGLHLGA